MEQTHPSVFFVHTRTTLPLSTDTHISLHEPSYAATDPTMTTLICVTPLPPKELLEFADKAPSSVKLNYFLSLRPLPARELHRLSLCHSFCFNILLPWDNSFRNTGAFRQIETSVTENSFHLSLSGPRSLCPTPFLQNEHHTICASGRGSVQPASLLGPTVLSMERVNKRPSNKTSEAYSMSTMKETASKIRPWLPTCFTQKRADVAVVVTPAR